MADHADPQFVARIDASDASIALIAELEQALATAREQQALLRSSLATVMGFLDRETDTLAT